MRQPPSSMSSAQFLPVAVFTNLLIVLFSCSPATSLVSTEVMCRVVFTSAGQNLQVKAMMESGTGQALDGGLVQVTTPANAVSLLEFDQTRTAYTGQFSAPGSGTYAVRFRSAVFPVKIIHVPFQSLGQTPDLTEAIDGIGHSAFAAQTLSIGQPISLGWTACPGADVYVVTISQGLNTIYSATTSQPNLIVLPGTLTATGAVYVRVTGQSIRGDVLLDTQDYYSVSQLAGSSFYFQIGP